MKKTVYIETTIPSYYYEERREFEFQKNITREWWDNEKDNFLLYISEIVIAELEFGEYPNKDFIIELIYNLPRLEVIPEIKDIVEIYLKNYLMPKRNIRDAFHLAIASYYKIEYLLTWNCEHLANVNKQEHIRIINNRIGLSTPYIITPLQMFPIKEEKEDV
ncbi:MAG: hypothetical protein COS84_04320 [Armatimonadetes bacterium CG07_land_8_20_14_0_80_40_9]|nr:MAG: hypothetical protein COS84_04320 [Armatimonadetes bacterium CG07_land_8_20_14_0_80_40_9]